MPFVPLQVTATLRGMIALRTPIALDALLGAAICARDGIKPALTEDEITPLPIPVEKSACGRLYLATVSQSEVELRARRFINRRFPLPEAQAMGSAEVRRINIAGGPCKSFRLPLETQMLRDDQLRWWCVGDEDEVRALLTDWIGYLGVRRAVGLGPVRRWEIERCAPWGDGFPVMRNGEPLRPLPADWPGVAADAERAYRVVHPPYWRRTLEELCVVPRSA